jgi:hypothetical protein
MAVLQAVPRASRRVGLLFALALTLSSGLALATADRANAAQHVWCVYPYCWFDGGQWESEPDQHYLTGVYVNEVGSGVHTVGAGAAHLGSIAYGTGAAYHGFAGNTYTRGLAVNGTATVQIYFNAHSNY